MTASKDKWLEKIERLLIAHPNHEADLRPLIDKYKAGNQRSVIETLKTLKTENW